MAVKACWIWAVVTPSVGAAGPGMRAEEESCHSQAHESSSCGGLLDNRWPVMLTYAAMRCMSPQEKCHGSRSCDKYVKQCLPYSTGLPKILSEMLKWFGWHFVTFVAGWCSEDLCSALIINNNNSKTLKNSNAMNSPETWVTWIYLLCISCLWFPLYVLFNT